MRTGRIAGAVALAAALAAGLRAEAAMKNEHLRVTITGEGEATGFEVRPAPGDDRVVLARFPLPVQSVTEDAVADPVWGPGRETRVVHEGGWQTTLRLFPNCPFLHVHTLVRNSGAEAYVTQSLQSLDMTVDLGGRSVMSLGTGGLASPSRAKGTYAFHAFADPETRAGLVTAWLTH